MGEHTIILTRFECRSAIISPSDKQVIIHDGEIEIKGWSYSGGGNWVERVEVSPDGYVCSHETKRSSRSSSSLYSFNSGHVWYPVGLENMTEKVIPAYTLFQPVLIQLLGQHYYAWRLWTIKVPVDAQGWLEFCVRTWDSSNNTEPTFVRSAWK